MRLTNSIKEKLLFNVVEDIVKKERAILVKEVDAFQTAVYNATYSLKTRNWMNKGPDEAFVSTYLPQLKDQNLNDIGNYRTTRITFKLFPKDTSWTTWKTPPTLSARGEALTKEVNAFNVKYQEIKTKIKTAINSCNTRKRLVETYPEFEKYAPDEAKGQYLAIRPQDISAIFNQPKTGE